MTKTTKKSPRPKNTTKQKTSKKRRFAGLFNGRQQKGKAAILAIVAFAAVGTFLLMPSHAATVTVAPTGTYTDLNWPGTDYSDFSWQVTANIDQTGPDAYFYSHQFGFVNGSGGYAGMQGDNNGKRAIFSIWSAIAARGPGIAQPFGGEGTGYQTLINYPWVAGRMYRYKVQRTTTDVDGVWWGASVSDSVTGVTSQIGEIKLPLSWGGLNNFSVFWTERYGGQMSTCSDIHHSSASFNGFTANNGQVFPSSHNNHLSDPVNCPGSQITDGTWGSVTQQMGVGNDLPPIISAGTGTSLSDLTPTYATVGYGTLQKDHSVDGHTITLNGQRYARGLGSHANADIRYNLAGQYSKFQANVGVDDEVGNNGVISFQVWADGVKLYDSGNMNGPTTTQAINVDVTGRQELKLIVTDGGDGLNYDHGDWADARLTLKPSDTVAPKVSISSPSNGARVYSGTYISASSSDNVGVTRMEIYVDGALNASSAGSSINYTWISYYAKSGSHTITVKAYDAAGNIGQSNVVVTK